MYHIDEECMKAASNAKLLKIQIMDELKARPGISARWLECVQQFLDAVGADVVLDKLIKQESGIGNMGWSNQKQEVPPIPPVRE